MKKINIFLLISLVCFCLYSCNQTTLYDDYDGREHVDDKEEPGKPGPEPTEVVRSTIRDLVLISSNLDKYQHPWTKDQWLPYVAWQHETNKDWLFDGFLFADSHDNEGHSFMMGHGSSVALKEHWENWANMLFTADRSISALNTCISEVATEIGKVDRKRKVIIAIPEPQRKATEWGEVDGKMLNMMNDEDRLAACKWFVNLVIDKFEKGSFTNLELEGFYWIAEEVKYTGTIIPAISEYLCENGFSFLWIPWWNSPGYNEPTKYGFSEVYLQPNYFWNNVEYSRLQDACDKANKYDINLEIECDESVYRGNGQRLYDYLEVFKENNVHLTKKLAYYQSINVFGTLGTSLNASDKQLYDTLCEMIIERQKQDNPSYIK